MLRHLVPVTVEAEFRVQCGHSGLSLCLCNAATDAMQGSSVDKAQDKVYAGHGGGGLKHRASNMTVCLWPF